MAPTRASDASDRPAAAAAGGPAPTRSAGGAGGLADVHRLRMTARRDRQGWPFALVVLGLLVVLAAPFYIQDPARGHVEEWRVSAVLGPLADIGPSFSAAGRWAGLYWVAALAGAAIVVAAHYRRLAARRGIAGPLWPVVVAGVVLLIGMLALTPRLLELVDPASDVPLSTAALTGAVVLSTRGLTPLLLVALVLVVLAWTERSPALAAITAAYLGLALVANLYDLQNLGYRVGLSTFGRFGLLPNLLLPGLFLLATGGTAAVRRRGSR